MSKEDKETKAYALGLKDGRSSGRNEALQEAITKISFIKNWSYDCPLRKKTLEILEALRKKE